MERESEKGRLGGTCRGGPRKESLTAIKRARTGTGKAGDKLCMNIIKDGEGKPVRTKR